MYSDNDIFNLAEEMAASFVKYSNWYKYEGGKAHRKAQEDKVELEAKKLCETKMFCDYLKTNLQEFKSSTENMDFISSIIHNTANLEWKNETVTKIDWVTGTVYVSKNGIEVEI